MQKTNKQNKNKKIKQNNVFAFTSYIYHEIQIAAIFFFGMRIKMG